MGCHCLKSIKAAESLGEECVSSYESTLGFSSQPVEFVIQALSDCMVKGGLTQPLLKEWLTQARLQTSLIDIPGSPLNAFYENFRVRKRFSAKKLTVLSVLLTEGTARKKAEILYSACDKTRIENIHVEDALGLVEIACDIALLYVPRYATMETTALRDVDDMRKLQKYVEKLEKSYTATIEEIQNSLSVKRDRLTSDEFIDLVTSQASQLVESHAIRVLAHSTVPKVGLVQSAVLHDVAIERKNKLSRSSTMAPVRRSNNRPLTISGTLKMSGSEDRNQPMSASGIE